MTELPAGWAAFPLDEIAEVRLGRQRSPENHSGANMRPYLRAANVGWSGLRLDDVKEMNFTEEELQIYQLCPGDIMVGEASGSPYEVGKPAIWSGQIDTCAFQNTLLRVRSRGTEPRYILNFLRHLALSGAFAKRARGVGIHHIGRAALASWLIPVPPVSEQRRIVELLEGHLSRVEAAERAIAAASRRLQAWGLSSLWHETHGHPGSLSRLDEVAEVRLGRQRSPSNHSGPRMRPYLRAANVHWDRLRLDDVKEMHFTTSEEAGLALQEGDILVVEASGSRQEVGKSAMYRGEVPGSCFQNTLLRVRVRVGGANPDFVQKYLLAEAWAGRLVKESRGVGIHHIGRARLAGLPVSLPSLEVQRDAVARASSALEALQRAQESIAGHHMRADQFRRSLLNAAFSGRLTV